MIESHSFNRRAFLKTTGAAALVLTGGALVAASAQDKPGDDEILAQCRERIEKHRKGRGVIVLRDALGRPVSRAKITVEQLQHEFLFGCNFFMFDRNGDAEREEKYRTQFAALLNYATLPFYWASYESTRGRPNYGYSEKTATWCREHGIQCKGHPLVWDHPAGSPAWLPDDDAEMARLSLGRVRDIVARFKGQIDIWDVVNEATHLPGNPNRTRLGQWAETLGPVEYVRRHLQAARAANPAATLLVNDYRTDPAYFKILDAQRASGRLTFDAVGIQSHMHGGLWPLHKVWDVCDTYARLGRPLHFTETTLVSGPRLGPGENWGATTPAGEAKQAEQTVKFYTALFAHPAVQAITWWDFSDHGAWQRAAAGWLRGDMSPKPVYERLHSLIKGQWWTKLTGQPNALGVFPLRAFYGRHRVTVELPGGRRSTAEIHWRRGGQNQFVVTVR
jgi:endo-1,4-beta-xylanase